MGADIVAFDPVADINFKRIFPEGKRERGGITYVSDPVEALKDANICFVFTEWKELRELEPKVYKDNRRTPLVYDGRNIYDVKEMQAAGIEYYSIGRGEKV